jgi:hypothetical protein
MNLLNFNLGIWVLYLLSPLYSFKNIPRSFSFQKKMLGFISEPFLSKHIFNLVNHHTNLFRIIFIGLIVFLFL